MDLLKTKVYLDKLNREFVRLGKDPENIARIDIDIMASYVRELYDAILSDAHTATPKAEASHSRKSAISRPSYPEDVAVPAPAVPAPAPPPPPPIVVPPAPAWEPPPPPPPPPVVEEKPAPVVPPPPPPPEVKPAAPAPVVEPIVVKAPPVALANGDFDVLFEEKQAKELSEKLSEMPIADLRRAIALNDRLLLTRELFAGDGQAFESTIAALNSCGNFMEAKAYLIEHCVVRYAWTDKKRLDTAKDFVKLVRRRYK